LGEAVGKARERIAAAVRNEGTLRLLTLLALTLGAAGVRLAYLFQPIVHDEAVTYVYFASRPLGDALSYYPFPNNHLLNTLLIKGSVGLFGNSPWALRLPAFIAGVLLVPAAYLAIRSLYGRDAALLGTAFVAVSSTLIFYSVSARGYTMQALFFMIAIVVGVRLLKKQGAGGWFALGILVVLGFYAVPTMLYFAAALFIWLLFEALFRDLEGDRKQFVYRVVATVVGTAVVVVLLYLPVVIRNGIHALSHGNTASLTLGEFANRLPRGVGSIGNEWQSGMGWVVFGVLLFFFIFALVFQSRLGKQKVSLPLVFVVVGFIAIAIQRVVPYARNWLPALPLFFGAASAAALFALSRGIALLRKERATPPLATWVVILVSVLVALGLGTSVVVSGSAYQPAGQLKLADADRLAAAIRTELRPGDVVYLEPNVRKPLEYYLMRRGVPLTVLYGYAGYKPDHSQVKRALIVDVRQKSFPLSKTLRYGHLDPSDASRLVLLRDFGTSALYQVSDP
jgi:4-amino-4-deoxy-L-arabinose transferase-like glycosyltransferase